MLTINYRPVFFRHFNKLSAALQDEIEEKIELFQRDPHHPSLKTHRLKGKLKGSWSFSVNYQFRIIFEYESKNAVVFMAVGDHSVYE